MEFQNTAPVNKSRMSIEVVWIVVLICILPLFLNRLGMNFESPKASFDMASIPGLDKHEIVEIIYHHLAGNFTHTILEWSGVCVIIFTALLAFAHINISHDVSTPIIGIALFSSGSMDAFHTLAANRLIDGVADNQNIITFTWAICRLYNSLIMIIAVSLILFRKKNKQKKSLRLILSVSFICGILTYTIIQVCAASSRLPQTIFPYSIITRPYDLAPLFFFILAGSVFYPSFHRRNPSTFSYALIISVIPNVATQLHMAFGSTALFDNHFNIAHFLKVVAYLVPFAGLSLDYIITYRESFLSLERVKESNEKFEIEINRRIDIENEKRNLADRHSKVLRSIGEGVIVTDSDNRLLLINKVAEELLGIKEKESLMKTMLMEFEDEGFTAEWIEFLLQDKEVSTMEMHIGSPVSKTLLATQSKYRNDENKLMGNVTILRDISREKEIDRIKTEFISSVSHELRTPLTSIKGFTSTIIHDKNMTDEIRIEFLEIVEKESDRLSALIEDLLDISRIESNNLKMRKEKVSLQEIIINTKKSIQPQFDKKKISLEINLPNENFLFIIADSDRVTQVFQNLLSNAVKFTPEGGKVKVISVEEDSFIQIEVRDTGIGISKKDLNHIFEKFYRAHSPTMGIPGTGLGLSIVKSIVEDSGGKIDITSKANNGTSVFLKFPKG